MTTCNTCAGVPPASGLVCICGGTGRIEDEIQGLRKHAFDLERKLDTSRRSARLAWEVVHHIAQQFNLPHCESIADKELAKLKAEE